MVHRAQSKDAGRSNNETRSITIASMDAVAGAVAGGISRTITSPLDVIKIRFQVQIEPTSRLAFKGPFQHSKYNGIIQAARDIVREEGIVGLWRGNVPALLMVMPYTAIQFVVLHKMKTVLTGSTKGEDYVHLNPVLSFLSGALAGCAATVGSYPFDFLRTVLAFQGEPKVYPTLRAAFFGTLRTRGPPGLYAGLTPTLVEIIPYAGIQFGSYDAFKRWAMELNRWASPDDMDTTSLSKVELFACGFAAGTTAKIACHPLDVVKKRFQVDGLKRHPRYGANFETSRSVLHTTKRILQIEGPAGLYKGLVPSLVKAAPASAITFVTYELVSEWLQAFVT